jgi:hypothetical protein
MNSFVLVGLLAIQASSTLTVSLPTSIGVVGVGTIGSATVRGLLSAPGLPHVPSFVLYDINMTKAEVLKAEFPKANVSVAARYLAATFFLALFSLLLSVTKKYSTGRRV